MKVAFVSDLHVNLNPPELVDELSMFLSTENPDVLVMLGDVCTGTNETGRVLCRLSDIGVERALVPGNHDIWLSPEDIRSFETMGQRKNINSFNKLRQVEYACKRHGWTYLPSEPLVIDNRAFVGTIGWYDYSFRDENLMIPIESYEAKQHHGLRWNDGSYVRFPYRDRKNADRIFCNSCNENLERDISQITENDTLDTLVACTHHAPFNSLQKGMASSRFFRAYGGNRRLGEILVENDVDISVSGHLHRNIKKNHGSMDVYSTAIGYLPKKVDWNYIMENHTLVIDL